MGAAQDSHRSRNQFFFGNVLLDCLSGVEVFFLQAEPPTNRERM